MPTRLVSSPTWVGLPGSSGLGLMPCRPHHKPLSPSNLIRLASDLDHWTVLRHVTGQSLTFLTATAALASASRIAARPPNRHAVLAGGAASDQCCDCTAARSEAGSEYAPGAVAPAPGYFAQAELGDKVLGGAGRHAELGGDQAGRNQRPREHEVDQRRQLRVFRRPASCVPADGAQPPAVVILYALPGPERDSFQEGCQPCRSIPRLGDHAAAGAALAQAGQVIRALPCARNSPETTGAPSQGRCCSGSMATQASPASAAARRGGSARAPSTTRPSSRRAPSSQSRS